MNRDKLMKMAGAVRTGGKGSVRRKKKAVHKTTTTDDKRLQSTLKTLGVNTIPAIEEVKIFKDDDSVIQFLNPKVQASTTANTWVVSGSPQTKRPDNMDNLRNLPEACRESMGGEVAMVPEHILKKNERDEEWALAGKTAQDIQDIQKKKYIQNRKLIYKRAEQYVKEYAEQEKELIRLKREAKLKGGFYINPTKIGET